VTITFVTFYGNGYATILQKKYNAIQIQLLTSRKDTVRKTTCERI